MGNKSIVNEDSKKKGFWQRHPTLRTLLTVFLCLLLIGVLMIAVYHIMNAINNSKKNDEIDEAKKADENVKSSKDKLTEEQKEQLEKGELKSEDLQKNLDKEMSEAADATNTRQQFSAYKNSTDTAEQAKIANDYVKSQVRALQDGKLDLDKLQEIADKENNNLKVAQTAEQSSFDNLTKNKDFTTEQADAIKKGDAPTTSLNAADTKSYTDYKNAISKIGDTKKAGTTTDEKLFTADQKNDIIDGKIKYDADSKKILNESGEEIKFSDKKDQTTAVNLVKEFAKVADNDNNIFKSKDYAMTDKQREAVHYGTFDESKEQVNLAPSEQQQILIKDYKAKSEALTEQQEASNYANNRYKYADDYQTAVDKDSVLTNFEKLEREAISTKNAKLSNYLKGRVIEENDDVTRAKTLLDDVKNIEKNQAILDATAKKEGATLDDAQSVIEKDYIDKFPKSDGAFRIIGDAAAAAGVLGAIGTGICAAASSSQDEDGEEVVNVGNNSRRNIINDNATNNAQQYYSKITTTTVSK